MGAAMAFVLFAAYRWPGLAVLTVGVAAVAVVSRIPAGHIWRSIRPFLPILLLTLLAQAVAVEGDALVRIGSVAVTEEGLRRGGLLAARLAVLLVWGGVLVMSTAPLAVTDAVIWYLRPLGRLGLPIGDIALVMSLALRFIPVVRQQADRLVKAQKARGVELSVRAPVAAVRALVPLVVPLLVLALKQADDTADAVVARCYQDNRPRTHYRSMVFGRADWLWLAGSTAWLACSLALGRGWLRGLL
jgi:energy-coupling factor transport system permease protein